MNPVKAKIIKTMDKYKYSSYNEFLNEKEIIDEEGIKLIFGDIKTYKEEFNKIHNNKLVVEGFIDIKEKCSEEFVLELKEKNNEYQTITIIS